MAGLQNRVAPRVTRMYRTASDTATLAVAEIIPIDLFTREIIKILPLHAGLCKGGN